MRVIAVKGSDAEKWGQGDTENASLIQITNTTALDETELHETFIRASGPGGQNINKVATAVQLRFHVRHSPSLPDDVRARLIRIAGKRVNTEGVIVIEASRFRAQEQNRADALDRVDSPSRDSTEDAAQDQTSARGERATAGRQEASECGQAQWGWTLC